MIERAPIMQAGAAEYNGADAELQPGSGMAQVLEQPALEWQAASPEAVPAYEIWSPPADPFTPYLHQMDGTVAYAAGLPSYPRNFTRDTVIAGILSSRPDLLANQLEISAHHQGTAHDPRTGEEPGKIHHELPGVNVHGREQVTTYNGCDTTALFLIAAEGLAHLDPDAARDFMERRQGNVERAVEYLLDHLGDDNLFWERPPKGADKYAIYVSYWKDSILPHPEGKKEPDYPVTFSLAHFMAARGLLSASRLLGRDDLAIVADAMYRTGIHDFIRSDTFVVYRDSTDELHQPSSDELHALAYIPAHYSPLLPFQAILQRAETLSTPFGYMCTPEAIAQQLDDPYHANKVWTQEQAEISYGARKFALPDVSRVAASVAPHINTGQELFGIGQQAEGRYLVPEGNDRQLWAVAAREYFLGNSALRFQQWL